MMKLYSWYLVPFNIEAIGKPRNITGDVFHGSQPVFSRDIGMISSWYLAFKPLQNEVSLDQNQKKPAIN